MTKIIEIKDKIFRFCGEYEVYLQYAYKFLAAVALFCVINSTVGFMEEISTFPVALLLALVCCLLPKNVTLVVAAVLVVVNLYTISLEVALVALIIVFLLLLLYFRFAPQDTMLFILTPVAFQLGIPYLIPLGTGLMKKLQSVMAVACGTIMYYFVDGIHQNIKTLGSANAGTDGTTTDKLTVAFNQLFANKEMFLVVGIFVLSTIMVYIIRHLSVDNAWKIAIISGTLVQISGLFAGYLLFSISEKTVGMIIGCIISMILAFVLEFLFMDLDYSRTERVQFEDNDYYYFVKAVPKKMVTSEEKTIKQFGGEKEEQQKRMLADELDIDIELLD